MYRVVVAKFDGLALAEERHPGISRCVPNRDERVSDGFPIVLDEDGYPAELFLAFFAAKEGLAATTQLQYANALVAFNRYLEKRGVLSLLDASDKDLTAYRLYRTRKSIETIGDYSFRVDGSAIRQFYSWAKSSALIARSPVKMLSRNGRDNLSTNRLRHSKIRHVDSFLYQELLRAAGGMYQTSGIARSPARNVAAVKTLATSGLRLQEFRSLLTLEIDNGTLLAQGISIELEATAKYRINRNVILPTYAVQAIRRYRKVERPDVVNRAQRALHNRLDSSFVVTSFTKSTGRISGVWQGDRLDYLLHLLPVEMRLKAIAIRDDGKVEPLCVFISEGRGVGMTRSGWEDLFVGFSDAMSRQFPEDDRIRKVTPHDLRHTFAINFLRAAYADRMKAVPTASLLDRPVARDPLICLQELLGHASAAQTLQYVRYVEDIDRLVAAAVPSADVEDMDASAREHAAKE
ncbi:integrase [Mycobacterium gordonae]|uniref:Integrase n=1 Tax=Mycobacterium gordonae TaxID=1778 RepID=A0A0Q2LRX3_MYCGO|nr:site-specific integrase [Mycobacterium gordonae]KQH78458.1 integrase [Mycobacterium gordonae]